MLCRDKNNQGVGVTNVASKYLRVFSHCRSHFHLCDGYFYSGLAKLLIRCS